MIRRHSLVWLRETAGDGGPQDAAAAWREAGNPFIVCRTRPGEELSLGFCLPGTAGNPPRRWPYAAQVGDIVHAARPPLLLEIIDRLPGAWRERVECFAGEFAIRLVGSRMWDALLGGGYVRPESDLDVVVDVASSAEGNAAVDALASLEASLPCRVDGEISLESVGEIAWREWNRDEVLVKSLDGVRLEKGFGRVAP